MEFSNELKETLRKMPHIQEVYFTESGAHFFNQYELKIKGKGTGEFYGRLKTDAEVYKVEGERKFYRTVSIADDDAKIAATFSREDILGTEGESAKRGKRAKEAEAA